MIVVTSNNVEGRNITEYKGLVFGEVIAGVDFIKDFKASLTNIFGGRSSSYEEEIVKARQSAIDEMIARANALGADAIIGIKVDYEVLGANNGMLMAVCSGTAVKLD